MVAKPEIGLWHLWWGQFDSRFLTLRRCCSLHRRHWAR